MINEPQPQGTCELQGRRIEALGLSALVLPVDARRWVLADNRCTYSMNSTKVLGINIECIPATFLQRRSGRLCINSVEKHSGATVEDAYLGYMTEMTQQAHVGLA
jgi:hypothetical protein